MTQQSSPSALDAIFARQQIIIGSDFLQYDTLADFETGPEPSDNALFKILSMPDGTAGEFRYSTTSGSGFAADNKTILRLTANPTGNGVAYSTAASAIAPTVAALRAMVTGKQTAVNVQARSFYGDGGGGNFDVDATDTTTADDGIYTVVSGAIRRKRRDRGTRTNARWAGVHPANSAATNDTNLAAALTVAHATTKALHIPGDASVHAISASISVPAGVALTGDGWHSRLQIAARAGTNSPGLVVPANGASVKGLHLIGDRGTGGDWSSSVLHDHGVSLQGVTGVTVDSCFIEGVGGNGVFIGDGCLDYTVTGNTCFANIYGTFSSGADIGLYNTTTESGRGVISFNRCYSNTSQGICIDLLGLASDAVCMGNICLTLDPATCTEGGAWSLLATGGARRHGILATYNNNVVGGPRLIISGNICRNTRWTGIYRTGAVGGPVLISGNICSENGYDTSVSLSAGIWTESGTESLISCNIVDKFQNTNTGSGGIVVNGPGHGVTRVTGNVVTGSLGYGINLTNAALFAIIDNNTLKGNAGSDINWTSSGAYGGHEIHDNHIYRTVGTSIAAIYLTGDISVIPTKVYNNHIYGAGASTVSDYNCGILVQCNYSTSVELKGNEIRDCRFGIMYYTSIATGRLFDWQVARNQFTNCTYAYGAASYGGDNTTLPCVDDILINTATFCASPDFVGGYPCAYRAQKHGDALTVFGLAAAPTGGTWAVGDSVQYAAPTAGGFMGAVCTGAGAPGTWKTYGAISP